MSYAELAAITNFSFLRGASHPREMVTAAAALGLEALGVADRNSLAGVVRAHTAARELGVPILIGARLVPRDGPEVIAYPTDRAAYARLSKLLSRGKRRAGKGDCALYMADLVDDAEALDGLLLIAVPPDAPVPGPRLDCRISGRPGSSSS